MSIWQHLRVEWRQFSLLSCSSFVCAPVSALQLDDLDPDKEWDDGSVKFVETLSFASSQLRSEMVDRSTSVVVHPMAIAPALRSGDV